MSRQFDVIVIGSGFGGAITARRLAEKGMNVLILERGRRWDPATYPRKPGDAWVFSHDEPERHNGWLDMRFFKHMTVAQAAGVGGGSLTYSSVALEANPGVFTRGWPAEITYAELKPYYDTVAREMDIQVVPDRAADAPLQDSPRGRAQPRLRRAVLEGRSDRQLLRRLAPRSRRCVRTRNTRSPS